ncbi:hypothetical protein ACQJBY_018651 [Aegilops geniculata]
MCGVRAKELGAQGHAMPGTMANNPYMGINDLDAFASLRKLALYK